MTPGKVVLEDVCLTIFRSNHRKCSIKKTFWKNSPNAQKNTYEFCKIFKNTLFTEHLLETASEYWEIRKSLSLKNPFLIELNAITLSFSKKHSEPFLENFQNCFFNSISLGLTLDSICYMEKNQVRAIALQMLIAYFVNVLLIVTTFS